MVAFGLGESSGESYIVMEYVDGDTLHAVATTGPVPIRQVLEIAHALALFRVYLRAHDGGDITCETDDALVGAARRELKETFGVAVPPVLVRACRWPAALPQYTIGHGGRVAHIRERLAAHRGLFVAGAAYAGVGIPDCIASGEAAADEALVHCGAADQAHAREPRGLL